MEDLIKIKDIGYDDTPEYENDTSDNEEYVFSSADSEDEVYNFTRSISLGQIVLFQCIICVLVVVAIVIMNYTKPDMAKDFLHNCHIQIDSDFNYKQELAEIISKLTKFINAKI